MLSSVTSWSGRALALAFGLACFSAAVPAHAHIILISDGGPDTPKDWLVMDDTVGDPQKPTPCGAPGTPTNIITTFHAGQTITMTWNEAIVHSGHFRIAFGPGSPVSATATTFPDPVVTAYTDSTDTAATAVAVTPAGGTISPNVIVLADNLFPHCQTGDPCAAGVPVVPSGKTYSTTVTLPTTPCTNCTLQLVQFMSYHGPDPSFFYHHCAEVTILASDAGVMSTAGPDASVGGTSGMSGTTGASGGASGTGTPPTSGTPTSGSASGTGATSGGGASGMSTSGTSTTTTSGSSTTSGTATSGSSGPTQGGTSTNSSSSSSSGGCSTAAGRGSPLPAALLGFVALAWRRRRRTSAAT